jgi:hypothetical protein
MGTEEYRFTGDEGDGALLCHVRYDLEATGPRGDCAACIWAFDLEIKNAAVVVDKGPCMTILGVDAGSIDSWNGTTKAYGFDDDYVGHAEILMFHDGASWVPLEYASWDPLKKTIAYEKWDGLYAY